MFVVHKKVRLSYTYASLSITSWRRMGSGGTAPRILNLGTRWRRVVSHAPVALSQGKEPPVPIG